MPPPDNGVAKYEKLLAMTEGDTLKVSATDMGFARDVESWCERTGNRFLGSTREIYNIYVFN